MVRMTTNKQIYAQIADIVHPVDPWGYRKFDAATAEQSLAEDAQERAEYLHQLMLQCDGDTRREESGYIESEVNHDDPEDPHYWETPDLDNRLCDPLIAALRDLTGQINTLLARQRELIAYGREFAPPGHRYTLEDLAKTVGMSVSGVRTSYDQDTVLSVARSLELGAEKRGALLDPRWVAVRESERSRRHFAKASPVGQPIYNAPARRGDSSARPEHGSDGDTK